MEYAESWAEIGGRVRESRLAVGLTQADLAGQVSLDRTALAKAEAGDRRLDALELFGLARALGVPVDHFVVRAPLALVSRRAAPAATADPAAVRDEFRTQVGLQAWHRDVRQLVELDMLKPPRPFRCSVTVSDRSAAPRAAAEARAQAGLDSEPVGRMTDVASSLGLLLLVDDVPADGASLTEADVGVGVIGAAADPGRRRTTAAHELGHHVLGDEYSADLGVSASRTERERIIDAFAAEFLLPCAVLAARWRSGADEATRRAAAIRTAADYRVSWSLLVRQATQAQLLGRSVARQWSAHPPTRAEFLASPGGAPQPDLERGDTPASYVRGVLDAYTDARIGAARAVEMLRGRLSEDDLPAIDDPDEEP
jgi:Zn-dependent peptidase ImmA (M78 family)/transcriptional regulator with XRE-family HTH domain